MPADVTVMQAQVDAYNAQILKAIKAQSVSQGGGSTITQQDLAKLITARDNAQAQVDRLSGASPMIQRGIVSGLSSPPACGASIPYDIIG